MPKLPLLNISQVAYFNEFDGFASKWLKELFPKSQVDTRSICDVRGSDISQIRCHFFAGIAGWEYALQLARWPTNSCVWTGSCPCQPFSINGKRKGVSDERHLWPEFRRIITECRPTTIFGEQVAGRDGIEWLAGVRTDLEVLEYAVGAASLCAPCVGSPQIRQRLFWVAHASQQGTGDNQRRIRDLSIARSKVRVDCWDDYRSIVCHNDGKRRRVKPGIEPLVNGIPGRVGRLSCYGNAIIPQVAAKFIHGFMECIGIQ